MAIFSQVIVWVLGLEKEILSNIKALPYVILVYLKLDEF